MILTEERSNSNSVFWSFDIVICDLFVIWCLVFAILDIGASVSDFALYSMIQKLGLRKEPKKPIIGFIRSFLVDIVAAVDGAAGDILAVLFPYAEHIIVYGPGVAFFPPDHQEWTFYLSAEIGRIHFKITAGARPVVCTGSPDSFFGKASHIFCKGLL